MKRNNPYKENLALARKQLKRLETSRDKFLAMSAEWEDIDCGMIADMEELADNCTKSISVFNEMIEAWGNGHA
ncbi:hypothetical protein C2W27_14490 [Salmonella enterica]|nr:hypothetical protein [Salmonella enterica]